MVCFNRKKCLIVLPVVFAGLLLLGCGDGGRDRAGGDMNKPVDADATIGSLGGLYQSGAIPVVGYGIVAGLGETGSSECPPDLRAVLVKYIQQQTAGKHAVNANAFINSKDTAVVEIYGVIPALAGKGDYFDVKLTALEGTQTTSIDGGRLFTANLKESSRFMWFDQYATTIATGHGPVFKDKTEGPAGDKRTGYVLGGGVVTQEVLISLRLFEPNFHAASAIRNRLNQRFGRSTAKATMADEIQLRIPARYGTEKEKFLAMVTSLYLADGGQLQQEKINLLAEQLAAAENKLPAETALEAMGKSALGQIGPLLQSSDAAVRFHAARAMLHIGDDRGLGILRKIAQGPDSGYRVEAIRAIGTGAKRSDAVSILNRIAGDEDFEARFAAYEQLRRLDDICISQTLIAGSFLLDSVVCKGPRLVFVSRADAPRIVVFGAPLNVEKNIFVESGNGSIIINAQPGEEFVSVMRKLPNRPRPIGPLKAASNITDIIRTLCQSPSAKNRPATRPGLGVSYCDLIVLLKQMCETGALKAQFRTGEMSKAAKPAPAAVNLEKKKTTTDNNESV